MSHASAQLKQIEIVLPTLHDGQQRITQEAQRFNVLACGRRFGKTTLGVDLLVDPAIDGYPVGWFSPTYKMLSEVWREMRTVTRPLQSKISAQEHRIELVTGGTVDMWSLDNPDAPRGRKYRRIVIDEAAMVRGLADAWQAVIRPTLTDYRGDAFLLSTPKGIDFFYECFLRGQDESQAEWASWQMPTTANPLISVQEVEAARRELPEMIFQQEYLAAFLQNAGAVFRNIEACLHAPANALPEQHRGHRVALGGDWGQKNDFTALSIGCLTCNVELALVRFNQLSWAIQRQRIVEEIRKWGVREVLLELNSIGSPNFEALSGDPELAHIDLKGFDTTHASKPPLIQSMVLAFERVEFQWLPDAVGKGELLAYESKISAATGRPTYSAPEGQHDDTVMGRALLNHIRTAPIQQVSGGRVTGNY